MFFQKARVTARLSAVAATAVQRMLSGLVEASGSMPEKIWTDPYAIGWISGFAATSASIYAKQNHLSDDAVAQSMKSGEIMAFVWEKIAPKGRSMEMLGRLADLSKSNDPEFKRGSDAAFKTLAFSIGGMVDPDDADILSATKAAKLLSERGVDMSVGGMLITNLFYSRFLDR